MRVLHSTKLCVLFFAAAPAVAQSWSITAALSAPATYSSIVFRNSGTAMGSGSTPAGAVGPGAFLTGGVASSGPGATSISGSWLPSVAGSTQPLAFSVEQRGSAQADYGPTNPYLAYATLAAQLDLTLQAPQPTSGRLLVRYRATNAPTASGGGSGSLTLDIGADAVVDFTATLAGAANGLLETVDLPVQIPAGGQVLRVAYSFTVSSLSSSGFAVPTSSASMTIEAEFFPDQPALQTFDTTAAGAQLVTQHSTNNAVSLAIGSLSLPQPGWLIFGFQPTLVVWAPTITQLVTADTILAVSAMTIVPPVLPPGTALYVQGLAILPGNALATTNSVRCLWP